MKVVPATWPLKSNGIAVVAEAPGKTEEEQGAPLVGESGRLERWLLHNSGIDPKGCLFTNVFNVRPPGNNLDHFCAKKKEVGDGYTHPPLATGKYVKPEYLPHLDRLAAELEAFQPNIVIALGNAALWALCRTTGIGKYRGAVRECELVPGLKVLPTYHPAAILRTYSFKAISWADHIKAHKESAFSEIRRERRRIHIEPNYTDELWSWWETYVPRDSLVSVDIETKKHKFLSCIGFAPTAYDALVVPFIDNRKSDKSYWTSVEEEFNAWLFCKYVLEEYPCRKIGQNFQGYDMYFLALGTIPIFPRWVSDDTMAEHHALQPEMDKDLGFLTSIYANEPAYKTLRPRGTKTDKREE